MSLSDTAIRNAKPKDKPYRMHDDGGLYVEVSPAGGRLWRMKYRFGGKEKRLSFGAYPAVSLMEARKRREKAREELAEGKDPGETKRTQKAAIVAARSNTFEVVARKWFDDWKIGLSEDYVNRVLSRLERDVFPAIGKLPISEVKRAVVSEKVIDPIAARGALETAWRAMCDVVVVIKYAADKGIIDRDPMEGMLPPAPKREKTKHFAAITDPVKVGELLRSIDQYSGSHVVRAALALAPLVFVRPGELRAARWADIDLERAQWRYYVRKTKTDHLVLLSRQAVAILRGIEPISGRDEFVFPGTRAGRPISNATINRALQAMGYDTQEEMTGHGFRAMARTLLAEEMECSPEMIEHQLAHKVPDALGEAYNRTKYLKQRTVMMQAWADYLDRLKKGADVIPLRTAG